MFKNRMKKILIYYQKFKNNVNAILQNANLFTFNLHFLSFF